MLLAAIMSACDCAILLDEPKRKASGCVLDHFMTFIGEAEKALPQACDMSDTHLRDQADSEECRGKQIGFKDWKSENLEVWH